jgi:Bifunctional DNA primase/polymerase, N-terminal/AAA domain/Primase C terminal 1 (PriCT-1)
LSSLFEVALESARRGWYVFPCWPKTKKPMTNDGFKSASRDEQQIRAWWTKSSDANVAIATGASGLTVLDIDEGINDWNGLVAFCHREKIQDTLVVRTGRRPGFGYQLYFKGAVKSIAWKDGEVSGDIRGTTGYVMAAGSIHPDSGEAYTVERAAEPAETPFYVEDLKSAPIAGNLGGTNPAFLDDGQKISDHRNVSMISILGKRRGEGLDDEALRVYALELNDARFDPPLGEDELEKLITNACKFPTPEPLPEITIGKHVTDSPQEPVDWREHYHTRLEMETTPPPVFLIDGFLLADSMTAIAAPVGQRKSIIALNVAHALCTGEPLFGFFKVTKRPTRVIYLCPEMGIRSFTDRVRKIGLLSQVGESLFCRTMNKVEGLLPLVQLRKEEVRGAVVIIDTVVRYLEGDENSSEHMRAFARTIFELKTLAGEDGAVVLLHHSSKGAKDSTELSLENCMRGSGEIGAFVTSCWATRLLDPTDSYNSASFMTNVKQRDFESQDFTILSDKTFRLHMKDEPGSGVTLGARSNLDGKEPAALAIIRENPDDSIAQLIGKMQETGIERKKTWVSTKRMELRAIGVKHTH